MRPISLRRAAAVLLFPVALAATAPRPASAQVTLNPGALDPAAPPASTAEPRPARKPAKPPPRKAAAKPAEAKPAPAAPSTAPAARSGPPPPAATLPTAVPPGVSLAPIVVAPPPGKPEPPPQAPIDATAGGGVEPIQGGVRVLFSPARTDLTPQTEAAIRAYAGKVALTPTSSFNVTAFAPGPPEDPSTPRRLSLSRALAIRSVLMGAGVPSAQIYLRALGANAGDGPADRADIVALGTNAPNSAPEAPPK